MSPRRALGAAGEQRAAEWYTSRGYQVLDRNWRCRDGELDLVAAPRPRPSCSARSRPDRATGSVVPPRRLPGPSRRGSGAWRSSGCGTGVGRWAVGPHRSASTWSRCSMAGWRSWRAHSDRAGPPVSADLPSGRHLRTGPDLPNGPDLPAGPRPFGGRLPELAPASLVVSPGPPRATAGCSGQPTDGAVARHSTRAGRWSTAGTETRPGRRSKKRSEASRGGRPWCSPRAWRPSPPFWSAFPFPGRVVVAGDAYNGTRRFLTDVAGRGRLRFRTTDVGDTTTTLAACAELAGGPARPSGPPAGFGSAGVLWLESPTNPLLAIADIGALTEGAHQLGMDVVVDNTFATPLLQRPLDLGADVVVHSATKLLSGHTDVVMGAVVARRPDVVEALTRRRSLHGAIAGPLGGLVGAPRHPDAGCSPRAGPGDRRRARGPAGGTPSRSTGCAIRASPTTRSRAWRRAR